MVTTQQRQGYERVKVGERRYLVCAVCRHPLEKGHDVLYGVPEVGEPNPNRKQALCGPCYMSQFELVYPGQPLGGVLFDGKLPGAEPILKLLDGSQEVKPPPPGGEADDFELWEKAIEQARASGGAERVGTAYRRLMSKPLEASPTQPTPGR